LKDTIHAVEEVLVHTIDQRCQDFCNLPLYAQIALVGAGLFIGSFAVYSALGYPGNPDPVSPISSFKLEPNM
jgi:hypothetical protein